MYYEVCMIDKYKNSGYYLYFLLLIDKIVLRHLVIFCFMAVNTNYYSVLLNFQSVIDITFLDLAGAGGFTSDRPQPLLVVIACVHVIIYGQFI